MEASKEEQRAVVRFCVAEGAGTREIHRRMSAVYGEHSHQETNCASQSLLSFACLHFQCWTWTDALLTTLTSWAKLDGHTFHDAHFHSYN